MRQKREFDALSNYRRWRFLRSHLAIGLSWLKGYVVEFWIGLICNGLKVYNVLTLLNGTKEILSTTMTYRPRYQAVTSSSILHGPHCQNRQMVIPFMTWKLTCWGRCAFLRWHPNKRSGR